MTKLKELLAELGGAMESPQKEWDFSRIGKALGKLGDYAADGEKDDMPLSERDALVSQVAQVRADVDSAAKTVNQMVALNRIGSPVREGETLRDGRPMMGFSCDAYAKEFVEFCQQVQEHDVKGLEVLGGEEGGYLVPEGGVDRELQRMVLQVGLLRRIASLKPLPAGGMRVLKETKAPLAYWKAPGQAATLDGSTFGTTELQPETLIALTIVPNELLEDSPVAIGNYLASCFAYAMAWKEDEAGFIGDGSPTYGGITGVLNSNRVTDVTMGSGDGFDDVDYGDLVSMEAQISDAAWMAEAARTAAALSKSMGGKIEYMGGLSWLMHPTVRACVKNLKDANQIPLWQRANERQPAELMGYLPHISGFFPRTTATTADARFMVLGDFTKGLAYGMRSRLAIDYSDHAYFQEYIRAYRAIERVDIAVVGYTAAEMAANSDLRNPIIGLRTPA